MEVRFPGDGKGIRWTLCTCREYGEIKKALRKALKTLRNLEWVHEEGTLCRVCSTCIGAEPGSKAEHPGMWRPEGHQRGCKIAAAIKACRKAMREAKS